MARKMLKPMIVCATALALLVSCGNRAAAPEDADQDTSPGATYRHPDDIGRGRSTIWDLIRGKGRSENVVQVNRYLWAASLEVLDFLPVQSIDPYTGVIVTGYGTPPGGGRAYRATVLIDDPALDARSLNVALQTRGGTASASTVRAVEDAILTRARQLRVNDNKF